MVTTAAASPFGDDWEEAMNRMLASLRTPAWEKMLAQMQATQAPVWQEAMKQYDLAAKIKLPRPLDLSALSESILANQNAQVQEAIKRLNSQSAVIRWAEVAKHFSAPTIPKILAPDLEPVIADLRRQLEEAHAPGIGGGLGLAAGGEREGTQPAEFDWIDLIPRKAQIRLWSPS